MELYFLPSMEAEGTMMGTENHKHELEEMYGPQASHSEHRVGDTISFREDGITKTGCILSINAPGTIRGKPYPMSYFVDAGGSFPSVVYPSEVITPS